MLCQIQKEVIPFFKYKLQFLALQAYTVLMNLKSITFLVACVLTRLTNKLVGVFCYLKS